LQKNKNDMKKHVYFSIFFVFIVFTFLFQNCKSETRYNTEQAKADLSPYLEGSVVNKDSLTIFDTTYYRSYLLVLKKYANRIEAKDSVFNRLILSKIEMIEVNKKQTKDPNIYNPIPAFFGTASKENLPKMMRFLDAFPKQVNAAKSQLAAVELRETQLAVSNLEKSYFFIQNEVLPLAAKQENYDGKQQLIIANALLSIKDFLGFLQSKINNKEIVIKQEVRLR
jgi:hypothetical protein